MVRKLTRKVWEQGSSLIKVRLLYTRITLTRFTTLYFFLALLNCIILVILQGITYGDNRQAANIISDILSVADVTRGLPVVSNDVLQICGNIPQAGMDCTAMPQHVDGPLTQSSLSYAFNNTVSFPMDGYQRCPKKGKRSYEVEAECNLNGVIKGVRINQTDFISMQCAHSLVWLEDVLRDAMREDLVTLCFQIWLFFLGVVTILNESLPHLCAGLAGYVLGTAWASYRVWVTGDLMSAYRKIIVVGQCDGYDVLGTWWGLREQHTIPIVIMNALALFTMLFLSTDLFRVYANQSFSRVGASPHIHQVYKLVLSLSASLQLAGFFSIASTAIWIDKISHGTIRFVAEHIKLYLGVFITQAVLVAPWLVLGWVYVRREYRLGFLLFTAISTVLLIISTLMFSSPLYRFIFMTWPFFATITVTAYIFVVVTSLLGVVCRLHFGRGLAHFLQVNNALEGVDFTPVFFSNNIEKTSHIEADEKNSRGLQPHNLSVHLPPSTYHPTGASRGFSVYSVSERSTIKLSSTPPLVRGFTLAGRRDSKDYVLAPISPVSDLWSRRFKQSSATAHLSASTHNSTHIPGSNSSSGAVSPLQFYTPLPPISSRRLGLPIRPTEHASGWL